MAIILEKQLVKGERIPLEKKDGSRMTNFCVGCNWGKIDTGRYQTIGGFLGFGGTQKKVLQSVDLDLSCIMVDENGNLIDHIYSPLYRRDFLQSYGMPQGKLDSRDKKTSEQFGALHHTGDDLEGDDENDGLDNEIITVDLARVERNVNQIFFFLNNCGIEDFSQIPYAQIRMFEGDFRYAPKKVFAAYDVAAEPQYRGKLSLIMGKLYRKNGDWRFAAIGDAFEDANICLTIRRILNSYAK